MLAEETLERQLQILIEKMNFFSLKSTVTLEVLELVADVFSEDPDEPVSELAIVWALDLV